MKLLPQTFTGRGEVRDYTFTQIENNPNSYVYQVDHPDGHRYYEIFAKKSTSISGSPQESYPRSKSFGKWAWWCRYPEEIAKFTSRIDNLATQNQNR